MAGKLYLYNPTNSHLKIKINDPGVNDKQVRFLAAASKETNWAARLAEEAVDRDLEVGKNKVGNGKNKFYIFRDATSGSRLDGSKRKGIEMDVWIEPEKFQLGEDLVVYLLFLDGKFGYVLLDSKGECKRHIAAQLTYQQIKNVLIPKGWKERSAAQHCNWWPEIQWPPRLKGNGQ